MIENSVIMGLAFSVLSALVLPLGIFVYCNKKKKKILKPFIIGALVFFISQIVLRIPIISYILPNQIWYIKLSTNPYLYGIFLGLTAGIRLHLLPLSVTLLLPNDQVQKIYHLYIYAFSLIST